MFLKKTILFLSIITSFFCISANATEPSNAILLKQHENVAIATDLEPDDVLALKIIFQKANDLYFQNGAHKYPVDLVIVGEGNTTIKRMRMEKLLSDYFDIPKGVQVKVVEGKSTNDNIFPFDGEELFTKEELAQIPYLDNQGTDVVHELIQFMEVSANPLIIQLKPTQELLEVSFHSDLAQKTTVLFYGSFNFRKTLLDQDTLKNSLFGSETELSANQKLQIMIDHFGKQFSKLGIIESYGLLGDQSSVYSEFPWTHAVAQTIENSDDPFLNVFYKLTQNWNAYLLKAELPDIKKNLSTLENLMGNSLAIDEQSFQIEALIETWNEEQFLKFYASLPAFIESVKNASNNSQIQSLLDNIQWSAKFINQLRPGLGIQFTLSDVGVALAAADEEGFFTARPVSITISSKGFLETADSSDSNVFYYNRVDREAFADILLKSLP